MASNVLKRILENAEPRPSLYATANSAVASEVTVVAAPGAGKRLYISSLTISCINADGTNDAIIQLRDGASGTIMLIVRCKKSEAMSISIHYGNDPLRLTANRALILLVSSVTTNHVTDCSVVYKAY